MRGSDPSEPALSASAALSLARGLDALDVHTDAPLRLRGHAAAREHEVFDLQEEFELGSPGRRYLVSVGPGGREMLLIPMDAPAGA
jgi:hypothetical protein